MWILLGYRRDIAKADWDTWDGLKILRASVVCVSYKFSCTVRWWKIEGSVGSLDHGTTTDPMILGAVTLSGGFQ